METELIACHEGTVASAKEMQQLLQAAGVESTLGTAKSCSTHAGGGGCGCGPKVQVLVHEDDLPKVQQAWRGEWLEAVAREGTLPADLTLVKDPPAEGEMPCPACGTAAPLKEGACSDCGLQLE